MIRLSSAIVVGLSLTAAASASAQITCDGVAEFPCNFQIRAIELQKSPAVLKVQARVSQARLPIGEGVFNSIWVKLLRGEESICLEEFNNVVVQESVLNLEIGRGMSCEMDAVIAENTGLAFQICLGGLNNCLRPIELAATPYAIKASYATIAQSAHEANICGQANYSHRATADREMFIRNDLGTGYTDFYTPAADEVSRYYPDGFGSYPDGGVIRWTPVGDPEAQSLHIGGKDHGTDRTRELEALVLLSKKTLATGSMTVHPAPGEEGAGLTVTRRGAEITGNSVIDGTLAISRATTVQSGGLDVTDGVVVRSEGARIQSGGLTVEDGGAVIERGGLDVEQGGARVSNGLTVQSGGATIERGGATVTEGGLTVSEGGARITGRNRIFDRTDFGPAGGNAPVSFFTRADHLRVEGRVVFDTPPEIAGGGDANNAYVRAQGEDRDLSFDGQLQVTGDVTFADDLFVAENIVAGDDVTVGEKLEAYNESADPNDEDFTLRVIPDRDDDNPRRRGLVRIKDNALRTGGRLYVEPYDCRQRWWDHQPEGAEQQGTARFKLACEDGEMLFEIEVTNVTREDGVELHWDRDGDADTDGPQPDPGREGARNNEGSRVGGLVRSYKCCRMRYELRAAPQ